MDQNEYDEILNYIQHKKYPENISKELKRRLREKSKSFSVVDGCLMHGKDKKLAKVIVDVTEQKRLIAQLHQHEIGGGHFGQTATLEKVSLK